MKQGKKLRKLRKILKKVRSYKEYMKGLSNEELAGLTAVFKERLARGQSLDQILPEAYAAICEADSRILGMEPFDVQVMGAIAMHQGNLVEMNTGEGKTLVATMPLYLNALTGKSTILLTTNDYLALRDAKEMGPVYEFMGLTVRAGAMQRTDEQVSNDWKRENYNADILYTTHGIFGFDYLLNNLVTTAEDRFMRELSYVIIDEADSVLLDASQTPLVISGAPRVQSNLYEMADFFVTTLLEDRDYVLEDKKVWLTEEGIAYTEQYFRIENLYGEEHFEINRHVNLALRAHKLFEPEKEYVITRDGKLNLLDNGSGRMMSGVKLRGGQHQALEMKEHITVSQEFRSMASITYQNLFKLFPKMAGMSGTISDAAEELQEVYGVDVIVIPPNRKLQRKDHKDRFYKNIEQEFQAAFEEIVRVHKTGQPILVVVSTIGETEIVSQLLIEEKIPHSVLNANNAFWEAEIIKEAGQMNAVTVATSMAGRGTDIRLGKGVKELGGLAVIGIGRMGNIRQERQARGRAGRQGDPGYSRFYVCLQNDVVRQYAMLKCEKYEDGKRYIPKWRMRRVINQAQKTGEEFAVQSRKQAMVYDQVLQRQRNIIYEIRDNLLDGGELPYKKIVRMAKENIKEFLAKQDKLDTILLNRYILDNLSYQLDDGIKDVDLSDKTAVLRFLMDIVGKRLTQQEETLGSKEHMGNFMRIATLQSIDDAWVEQVDYLQQLQSAVSGRSIAQRNPVFEYQHDGLESFQKMEESIRKSVIRNILLSSVSVDEQEKIKILLP